MNYSNSFKDIMNQIQKSVIKKMESEKKQNTQKANTKKNETIFDNNQKKNSNSTASDINSSVFSELVTIQNNKNTQTTSEEENKKAETEKNNKTQQTVNKQTDNKISELLNNLQNTILNKLNKNSTNQNANTQNTNNQSNNQINNQTINQVNNQINTQYAVTTTPVNIKYDKNGDISSASMKFGDETVSLSKKEILSYLNEKTQNYFNQKSVLNISEYVLKDVLTVKYAENQAAKSGKKGSTAYQKTYNDVIKAQMIKTPSNMTGEVGEIVSKDNLLYVNNGSGLEKLDISADTYIKLFPPVERFDINQGSIADCYFISGCLIDMMKNPTAFSELIQMFSEDNKGNISIKFEGDLSNYSPVTFNKGELKEIDGLVNNNYVKKYNPVKGALGLEMLEQAYSISKFAKESKSKISTIDIDAAIPTIEYGHQSYTYSDILNINSKVELAYNSKILDKMADDVNNKKVLFSGVTGSGNDEYDIHSRHAYSIEKIDTQNKIVYVNNPWYGSGTIALPYDVFEDCFSTVSYGYLK